MRNEMHPSTRIAADAFYGSTHQPHATLSKQSLPRDEMIELLPTPTDAAESFRASFVAAYVQQGAERATARRQRQAVYELGGGSGLAPYSAPHTARPRRLAPPPTAPAAHGASTARLESRSSSRDAADAPEGDGHTSPPRIKPTRPLPESPPGVSGLATRMAGVGRGSQGSYGATLVPRPVVPTHSAPHPRMTLPDSVQAQRARWAQRAQSPMVLPVPPPSRETRGPRASVIPAVIEPSAGAHEPERRVSWSRGRGSPRSTHHLAPLAVTHRAGTSA